MRQAHDDLWELAKFGVPELPEFHYLIARVERTLFEWKLKLTFKLRVEQTNRARDFLDKWIGEVREGGGDIRVFEATAKRLRRDILSERGHAYVDGSEWEDAITTYEEAIAQHERHAYLHFWLAQAKGQTKDEKRYREAVKDLDRASKHAVDLDLTKSIKKLRSEFGKRMKGR